MAEYTYDVLEEVGHERGLQDDKWGEQSLSPVEWVSVLTEEVGEAAQEANKTHWAKDAEQANRHRALCRAELLQVAAVAVACVECLDRDAFDTERV